MPGKYLKGAFIQMMPTILVPLPNVIIFQFNPETMTHTWTPASKDTTAQPGGGQPNPLAVKGLPGESFSFTLAMDANDMIADGSRVAVGLATASGIYSRLAALEMLLYPTGAFSSGGGLLGTVSAAASAAGSLASSIGGSGTTQPDRTVPQSTLPTVLFVWGPGRILPVRVTTLTITERLYDALLLNPTHAEAQIGLTVLTPDEIVAIEDSLKQVAKTAYEYSQGLRQALAVANLANAAESIIGMLPLG
jgi:hypothetical protein